MLVVPIMAGQDNMTGEHTWRLQTSTKESYWIHRYCSG